MKGQGLVVDARGAGGWHGRWLAVALMLTWVLLLSGQARALQVVTSWPLDDTGIDTWNDGGSYGLAAPPNGYPGEDASDGRDARRNDDADGHAGFAFVKLDANGHALGADAATWSCVSDTVTGLTWEVRPDDGGLRDRDWTYAWYNTDPTRNGGATGVPSAGSCGGGITCNTEAYVAAVNRIGLCGARDWRLPSRKELHSIVDLSRAFPAADTDYFPDFTWMNLWYWSSTPGAAPDHGLTWAAWAVNFFQGYGAATYCTTYGSSIRLVRGGSALDDHGNDRVGATRIAVDSRTGGRIEQAGDHDWFRLQIGVAGTLTVSTTGGTDTYGYLLNSTGSELTRNDNASATDRNFRLSRTVSPGTYYIRVRHATITATGAYTLVSALTATNGTVQRAVLLLPGLNSAPDTWNALVSARWSGQCPEVYAGVAPAPTAALPRDRLGAVCYRLRFGRYDATGAVGLEGRRCAASTNPSGCKGDFSTLYAGATGTDLGVEVYAAVRAILARLGSDTQVVLLGQGRGGLAARAFLERPGTTAERGAVVGLVTSGAPHRGTPWGRLYAYLRTSCLDSAGRRITSGNRAGTATAVWSACTADWRAVDHLNAGLTGYGGFYLGKPTFSSLATGSSQISGLNATAALANLPASLSVVPLRYTGRYLGHLSAGYSAWNRAAAPQTAPQFSLRARNYALCGTAAACTKTEDAAEFSGDGLVPASAQIIPGVSGAPIAGQAGTYHLSTTGSVGEAGRVQDIGTALGRVSAW